MWNGVKHVETHEYVDQSPVDAVDWSTKGAVTQSEVNVEIPLVSFSQVHFNEVLCCVSRSSLTLLDVEWIHAWCQLDIRSDRIRLDAVFHRFVCF